MGTERAAPRGFRSAGLRLGVAAAALAAAAMLGVGCAQLAFLPGVDGPADLRREAEEDLEARRFEEAYHHLAAIRRRFPESPESAEAFGRAAWLYRKIWYRYRFAEEQGERWRGEERDFMFDWLASECASSFDRRKANALLVQMPWSFWQGFRSYAEGEPRLSQWRLEAVEDNGRIEAVRVEAAEPAGS